MFRPRPTSIARRLRNDATAAERQLWRHLNRRQLGGYKFSRQMPLEGFICDFVRREARLVIEVDGGQHDSRSSQDSERSEKIERQGFRVIRFWNNEVIENIEGVLTTILATLEAGPPPAPPASGRGDRGGTPVS